MLLQGGCGVDGDANRGYRFFVETITANGVDDTTETFSPIGGAELDIRDCGQVDTVAGGTTTTTLFKNRQATFNFVVDVVNGFNYAAGTGLDVRLVTLIRSYEVVQGVNVQLPEQRVDFGDNGPVIDVDDNDRAELGVVVPFFTSEQAQDYDNQVLGINGGTDYRAEIRFVYQFYAQDNFGENVSATVSFPVQVSDYRDECN
ncbi:MAG: hypothetical protein D6761_01565 [Candidatus Dadabacteria bacterium]|nr:MAG: hypothetical protein D6761_01565 [Candidatus Dadabacteria bacterium]